MREISPAENLTVDKCLDLYPPDVHARVNELRCQKAAGLRRCPSVTLIDRSQLLVHEARATLLDQVALLVDENLFGRAEMCMQFADLLERALRHLGLPARSTVGSAVYYFDGREVFHWKHAWVRVGCEVVDGNVDVLDENPAVPAVVKIAPYWGPINETPQDRRLREDKALRLPADIDVSETWWPELRAWLDERFARESA